MDNSLKGLILAAGVIITCIVVGLGFFISREAKNAANNGTAQLSGMSGEYDNVEMMIYDGLKVPGREVVEVINKHASSSFRVIVMTKANPVGVSYSGTTSLTEAGDDDYINRSALFLGEISRDENNVFKNIRFTQQ